MKKEEKEDGAVVKRIHSQLRERKGAKKRTKDEVQRSATCHVHSPHDICAHMTFHVS